jgi:hypothetical protein
MMIAAVDLAEAVVVRRVVAGLREIFKV